MGHEVFKLMVKTFKWYIVYTNPPCNDRLSYHRSFQKSMRQVDQSEKLYYQPVVLTNNN